MICTPHLGASTLEAQQRVAIEIAENIIALNTGVGIYGAVYFYFCHLNNSYLQLNANTLAAVLDDTKAQYVKAASHLGQVLASIAPGTKNVIVKYPSGKIFFNIYTSMSLNKKIQFLGADGLQKALIASASMGLMKANGCVGLNLVNAEINAAKEGISVSYKY